MSYRHSARHGWLCMKTYADRRGSEWRAQRSGIHSAASAKFSEMATVVGANELNEHVTKMRDSGPGIDPNVIVNTRTASAIGLTVPREILLRADDVIE